MQQGDESEAPATATVTRDEDASRPSTTLSLMPQMSSPPPWPEWSDSFINNDSWYSDVPGADRFEESTLPTRSLNLNISNWMRVADFLSDPPVIVNANSSVLDLITPNAHLCEKSELIRYILSEISELYEYSLQNKFVECEGEGITYVPNYGENDRRWTPWSHIYSCCKAGVRGQKPQYNPKGKYYVRLYFMGTWRRIIVDDRVPVLMSGHSALPLTSSKELWPMLLTKALLKVAAVTWDGSDGKKFSVISALTGWVFEWIDNFEGVNEEDLWMDLKNTLPKYSDPKRIPSCYTLCKPCKKKYGPEEGSDTWWMPKGVTRVQSSEEVQLSEKEVECLKHSGEGLSSIMEVQWKRMSQAQGSIIKATESAPGITVDSATTGQITDEKVKMAKSRKLGKSRAPGVLEDNASDKKLTGKKNAKKGKEGAQPHDKKAQHNKETEKTEKDEKNVPSGPELDEAKNHVSTIKIDDAEAKKLGVKKNWSKIKDVLMGTSKEHLDRRSKSVPKDIAAIADVQEESGRKSGLQINKVKIIVPSLSEILFGVQKYAGMDYKTMIGNWENLCGKDSPIALVVVLKTFPHPEGNVDANAPQIPSFLQHPIQLTEIRDAPLSSMVGDRPQTPLWKRFRWKAWAMKKGLIPKEPPSKKSHTRAIKAKTPFVFKSDWYESVADEGAAQELHIEGEKYEEILGEAEDDDLDDYIIYPDSGSFEDVDPTSRTPRATQNEIIPSGSGPGHDATSQKKRSRASSGDSANHRKESGKADKPRKKSGESSEGRRTTRTPSSSHISPTVVLHEGDEVKGESSEEVDETFKQTITKTAESENPTAACATIWFECGDIAKHLRKFCKFYTSQSIFGSCYSLRREPTQYTPTIDPVFQEIHSELPKYPNVIDGFKQKKGSFNYNIEYDRFKSYSVTDYHINEKEGIDSGFYLFSDCYTEQELILTVDILQDQALGSFVEATQNQVGILTVPPPTPNVGDGGSVSGPSTNEPARTSRVSFLTLIMEPWNWRQDHCRCEPLISASIADYWITHIRLPPGRNTFRIWLMLPNPAANDTAEEEPGESDEKGGRKHATTPFSVRIISQTPIYLGSRVEVQNYMTNDPVLFLKQAEKLANAIWGVFACFGRKRHVFQISLEHMRRAYCPAASSPKMIAKFARGVHETFENLFLSLITQLNNGVLDRLMLLTLRVFFINPNIGRSFTPLTGHRGKSVDKGVSSHFPFHSKKVKWAAVNAAVTIQKYFRGWRVRLLLKMRNKEDRHFNKVEHGMRRLALLLAKETESTFSREGGRPKDSVTNAEEKPFEGGPSDGKITPAILPSPPYWAINLLKHTINRHPWLINIYPHVGCANHQVRIQEFEGELPSCGRDFAKCPFFNNVLLLPKDSKECFCEIDLQVYPSTSIYLKVKNNDTKLPLPLVNNRLFIGKLDPNVNGYTVKCYRWPIPIMEKGLTDRAPSNTWKLRLITPRMQEGPYFQSNGEVLRESFGTVEETVPEITEETETEGSSEGEENVSVSMAAPATPNSNRESIRVSF